LVFKSLWAKPIPLPRYSFSYKATLPLQTLSYIPLCAPRTTLIPSPPLGGVPILGLLCYIPLCAPPYSPEGALDKGVPYIRTTAAPATPGLWSLCRRAACYTPPLWVYKLFYGWLPPSATPAFHPPSYKPTIPSTPVLYGATQSYIPLRGPPSKGPPSLIWYGQSPYKQGAP
jgi:hypothetical protein